MINAAYDPADTAAAGLRESGTGIVIAGDRSKEFRLAQIHSTIVKTLRIGLPLSAAGLFGLYVWTIFDTAGFGQATVAPRAPANIKDELKMSHPKYDGYTKDGGSYSVVAEWAIPDLANPNMVKLETITGVMFDAKKSRTDMKAAAGQFDGKANKLDLSGGIDVTTETGMRARMQVATIMTKEGTIIAQQTDTPVVIEMPAGQITAYRMHLQQKTHVAAFADRVKTHLLPQAKPAPPAPGVDGAAVPAASAGFGHSNAPVDIVSEELDVLDDSKVANFKRNVRAVQSGASLETDQLNVTYEGKAGAGALNVQPAAGNGQAQAAKIKRIEAPGPVVLTQASGERLTGSRADFDAAEEVAVVSGNVVMTAGQDRRATADRVEFRQKADSFLLSGNVVVTQARNELRGRRLAIDRKAGRTEMTSPAENGLARSRIFAKLYQGDGKPGKAAKPAEDEAGAAGPAGLMQFKTDPNAPVDVEADRLLAEDAKKTATFTGDVKAAQGDFVIRTSELVATHSGDAGLSSLGTAHAPGAAAAAKTPTQLTRLDARGKVVITSHAGQEVTGDVAVFDMKANTGLVTGKEVILTQDKQVVRCNKLKIDMTSGLGNCLWEGAQASAPVAARPGAAAGAGARPTRPSAVFFPEDKMKGGKPKADAAPARPANPASSSWEASTAPNPN